MLKPLLINGQLQHYIWGGTKLLPTILGLSNEQQQPYAELWFGTHASAPAMIVSNDRDVAQCALLDSYLKQHPKLTSGNSTLPYLLKILDVANPLSIQVHPNKQQAELGFIKENRAQISLTAPNRNYKDNNHKPEIMVALTDCYLLYGFAEPTQIAQRLKQHSCLTPLLDWLHHDDFKSFYQKMMRINADQKEQFIAPLLTQLIALYHEKKLEKTSHDYWVAKAALAQNGLDCRDPGLLSIYTMNVVHVPQGKGIFQPAQLPHAYLEGGNIELMANSDNVLRGGLTPKHVDIDELLSVLIFEVATPKLIEPQLLENGWVNYPSPSDEVRLHQLNPKENIRYSLPNVPQRGQILLNIGTPCTLTMNDNLTTMTIAQGQAAFIPAQCDCQVFSETTGSILYLAS